MQIGIPREIHEGEARVAATPDVVSQLLALGFAVQVEAGAGTAANFRDDLYRQAGATIADDAATVWTSSDIVLKVRAPETDPASGAHETDRLRKGQLLISFVWPAQ